MKFVRWGAAGATTAAAAMAFTFACDPFGVDSGAPANDDAATSSSSSGGPAAPPPDGAAAPDGDGASIDAGDGAECFDFSNGNPSGFTLKGSNAQSQDGGVRIVVRPDPASNYLQKTFHRDGGITTTRVGVEMSITGTMPTGDQYVDMIALYYGLPAEYQQTPQTSFELVDTGGVDVDMWGASAEQPYHDRRILKTELPFGTITDQFFWIDSFWDRDGGHTLTLDTKMVNVAPYQLTDAMKNDLTVRVGGASFQSAPGITLLVHRICVTLH